MFDCRFKFAGQDYYGHVEEYHEEAKRWKAQGKIVVSDAITGQTFAIPKEDAVDIPFDWKNRKYFEDDQIMWGGSEHDDFLELVRLTHDLQEAKLRKSLGGKKKLSPGHQFQIGVGDGYACYVVVSVHGKRAKVSWRGFCADHYYDHHFRGGGSFDAKDVARYVHFGDPLFGKPETAKSLEAKLSRLAVDFQKRFGRDPLPIIKRYLLA